MIRLHRLTNDQRHSRKRAHNDLPIPLNNLPNSIEAKELIRKAINGEYDAISLYEQIAELIDDEKISKTMLSIAKEEKTHVGELTFLLNQVDVEQATEIDNGATEVADKTSAIRGHNKCPNCGKWTEPISCTNFHTCKGCGNVFQEV